MFADDTTFFILTKILKHFSKSLTVNQNLLMNGF